MSRYTLAAWFMILLAAITLFLCFPVVTGTIRLIYWQPVTVAAGETVVLQDSKCGTHSLRVVDIVPAESDRMSSLIQYDQEPSDRFYAGRQFYGDTKICVVAMIAGFKLDGTAPGPITATMQLQVSPNATFTILNSQ